MKVLTSDYEPDMMDAEMIDTIPVREVDSYSEAEGLFKEHAHGGPPTGVGSLESSGMAPADTKADSFDLGGDEDVDLPPGGLAVVFLLVGGIVLSQAGFEPRSTIFLVGVAFVAGGVAIFGWAGILLKTDSWSTAQEFLLVTSEESSQPNSTEKPEKTPPAPEKLKNRLIFDRANQQCEWCEESFDHPHVHHIKPRREGGPNEPENLIVLCPNCHEKADREAIHGDRSVSSKD